nr:unnamed protein product [Digitaria exilis]
MAMAQSSSRQDAGNMRPAAIPPLPAPLASLLVAFSRVGVACLRVRSAGMVLREEAADEIVMEARELKTDVSPLFAAAHAGHAGVVRALVVLISAQSL